MYYVLSFQVAECTAVIYFDVADETMTKRLLERGKTSGRVDDNEETIKKRLETFHNQTKPVVDYYSSKDKTCKVISMYLQCVQWILTYPDTFCSQN